ncbi:MAG: acyl carrier protein [Alphaproteobacteria bacterium]|nr:acyl carrier protein [Alphaproteobacteria bacterium]
MTTQIDEILGIVAQKAMIDRNKLTPDAKLADLNLTSLDMVEVIFALEDKFKIQLPFNANAADANMSTIGDVIAFVQRHAPPK